MFLNHACLCSLCNSAFGVPVALKCFGGRISAPSCTLSRYISGAGSQSVDGSGQIPSDGSGCLSQA